MLTEQLQKQIEQEAKERYGDRPGGTQSLQRACYKKGASKYADLWQAALHPATFHAPKL